MLKKTAIWIRECPCALCPFYFTPYLIYFELLEIFAVPKFTIHCPLDDWTLLHEGFAIPCSAWFPILAASLGYFPLRLRRDFLDPCSIMFTGMTICLLIYTIPPNDLQLRPAVVRSNLSARITGMLYAIDTSTNVCSSIRVSSIVAIMIVVMRCQKFSHAASVKGFVLLCGIAACLSAIILKQHPVTDIVLGGLLTLILYKVCM